MLTRWMSTLAMVALGFALPVAAHHAAMPQAMPIAPGPDATTMSVQGYVDEIVVENRLTGATVHFPIFVANDSRRFTLNGPGAVGLLPGDALTVTGKADGRSMFPQSVDFVAPAVMPAKPASATTLEGVLRLGHADNFDGTPSEFFFAVVADDGRQVRVALATMLGVLDNGMRVSVSGSIAAGNEMAADRIVILAPPGATTNGGAALSSAPVTTSYLVIPIKFPTNAAAPFAFGADPFTPASLASAVFAALPTSSVNEFYKEVSYGQQMLSGVVADNGSGGFLLSDRVMPPPPAAPCDINVIAAAADAAATARGYNLNSYTGRLYVFNNVPSCGWSGLAYINWARAYSNNTTNLLVIAHELGHNFGLLHAASLDCGANVIGGACTSSEYGDPFDVMGNNRAMHFNAAQKSHLNWLPAGSVANHASGTATYTLAPIELTGGTTYAVKVAAAANRTYWIEYRQAIGFDSALSGFPNNGAQIRVASPFESVCAGCADDTEFLDLTPATGAFTDGTLLATQSYTDSAYNVSINVTSATPTALTVQVTTGGGTSTTTAVTASPNPSAPGQSVPITATVTGTNPTGTVAFKDGANVIAGCGAVALTGGGNAPAAVCAANALSQGAHAITATYSGNAGNNPSDSPAWSQVVTTSSATALASLLNPAMVGQSVAFTVTVTGANPTGTVAFKDGANTVPGCGSVALTGSGNARTASCASSSLTQGTHSMTANYSGDAGNAVSASPALAEVVTIAGPANSPVLQSASLRRSHGGAGTFGLALSLATTSPSTEPRIGPAHTLVLTFDKAITGATVTVTEGTATAGAPTFSGNDVTVSLTGVANQQYVTIALTNVASADGGTGGGGTVRAGFLMGDVNQNRAVTFSDLVLANGQLTQTVSASNFLMDINANGVLTFSDMVLTNGQVGKSLPAP